MPLSHSKIKMSSSTAESRPGFTVNPVKKAEVQPPGNVGVSVAVVVSAGSGPRPCPCWKAPQHQVARASAAPGGAESLGSASEMNELSKHPGVKSSM